MKNINKTIGILIILLSLSDWASAQIPTASWDSTYRPVTYPLLTRQFQTFKHSSNDIVFLGNSITFGVDWYELLQDPRARNRGISGDITFGVLGRLQEVIDGKPAKIFILIGINDITRNIPDSFIIRNYRKMVERIQTGSPATKIYLQSILPVNDSFPQHKSIVGKNGKVIEINKALNEIARQYHVTYIDLHAAFCDKEGNLASELTYDGLHLTIEGYRKWTEILYKNGCLENKNK